MQKLLYVIHCYIRRYLSVLEGILAVSNTKKHQHESK